MWENVVSIVGGIVLVCTAVLYVLLSIGLILKGLWERVVCRKKQSCTNSRCPFYKDCFRAALTEDEINLILRSIQDSQNNS